MTLNDAIEFILKYRKGGAFRGYTVEAIASSLVNNTLHFVVEDGELTGVCTSRIIPPETFHVVDILTTTNSAFLKLVRRFKQDYPTFKLEGVRRGKLKQYNTMRTINKFLKENK